MTSAPSATPAGRFPASASRSAFPYLLGFCFFVSLALSLQVTKADPRLLIERQALTNVARFVGGMFPPELSGQFLTQMVKPLLETIQLSVMGTAIAVLIGFPLGLLATASLTWSGILHERSGRAARWLGGFVPYAVARGFLSVFRSIPEFVWGFMFVRAVGLGPFAGVLAIGIAYAGMLGKVYSEVLEGVDPRPLEALRGSGASKLGIALYGLVPQALPTMVSYTLYRWECAIRASAILGFVGAGGLGQQMELSMRHFQFNEVVTLLGILFGLVAGVDFVSGKIRTMVVRS